jgi:hypothetical protein
MDGAIRGIEELPELVPDEILIVMIRYARKKDGRNLNGFESHDNTSVFDDDDMWSRVYFNFFIFHTIIRKIDGGGVGIHDIGN